MSRWMAVCLSAMAGASVASLHLRKAVEDRFEPAEAVFLAIVGLAIALTAAGPVVWLTDRREGLRPSERLGSRLWALLGFPWWVAGLDLAIAGTGHSAPLYAITVGPVLWLVNVGTLIILLMSWCNQVVHDTGREVAWSQAIGLGLSVGWPVQLGLGMVAAVVNA